MASNITAAPDHRPTFQEAAGELVSKVRAGSSASRLWLMIAAALALVGLVGVIGRIIDGYSDRSAWGYYAAMVSFLLSTAAAAPDGFDRPHAGVCKLGSPRDTRLTAFRVGRRRHCPDAHPVDVCATAAG